MYNFRRMYNKDRKHSGYAFFDVDSCKASMFVAKPHLIKNTLINCKIAADNSRISHVQKDEMERKLYVSNLPSNTTDLDLLRLFQSFGKLTKAYLVRNRSDGSCKNFGFVIFQSMRDLESVLNIPQIIKFKGRKLTIKQAVDRQTQRINKKTHDPLSLEVKSLHFAENDDHEYSTKEQILSNLNMLNQSQMNYRLNKSKRSWKPSGFQANLKPANNSLTRLTATAFSLTFDAQISNN